MERKAKCLFSFWVNHTYTYTYALPNVCKPKFKNKMKSLILLLNFPFPLVNFKVHNIIFTNVLQSNNHD
jgi:hypothetical protein